MARKSVLTLLTVGLTLGLGAGCYSGVPGGFELGETGGDGDGDGDGSFDTGGEDSGGEEGGGLDTGGEDSGGEEGGMGFCGDGIVDPDEDCDDGNDDNDDACLNSCEANTCGDGYVGPGESCDDGNDDNDDGCTNTCAPASCGDGQVQNGEQCDDGNDNDNDACTNTCTNATCGDGIVGPGEDCDDGNNNDNDACSNSCSEASCGDGQVQNGEQCDDGNNQNGDGCENNCQVTPNDEVPNNNYCAEVANWNDGWTQWENQVLSLTNQRRANGANCGANGNFGPTGALTMDPALRCSSRKHSKDMVDRDFFAHTNPDGHSPFQRMQFAGYSYSAAGENIAAGQNSPAAVVNGWMNSDGHCANIMNPNFTELGVGYYPGGDYGHYWTQNFGKPQ